MRTRPVDWSEGLFVLPHHFQAAQENLFDAIHTSQDWLNGYAYGIAAMEINEAALANFELRIPRLKVRLKDGTLLSVPENAHLAHLDLQQAFGQSGEVYIHLLLPEVEPGRANASRRGASGAGNRRYLVHEEEWEERDDGSNPRDIQTYLYNVELRALPTITPPKGYESLPLVKLKRSQQSEAPPAIDPEYIPPLLACNAWSFLHEKILAAIGSQLGSFIKSQADYLRTHGGWTEANQPQIRRAIMQLFAVNSSYPYMRELTHARGVHPFLAYTELCRLMGQLSLFRDDWQPPELPRYDHDDLGRIFRNIKIELEATFRQEGPAVKVQRYPFMGVQEWMEVGLDPKWLRGGYEFFVGVRNELPPERLELLFSDRWLDWKLGSSRTILQIYRNAEAGLSLSRVVGVHSSLPALNNVTYFRLDPAGHYWDQVLETRTLALKVNENYIQKDFIGQNTITVVDPKNNPRDLQLELFVLELG